MPPGAARKGPAQPTPPGVATKHRPGADRVDSGVPSAPTAQTRWLRGGPHNQRPSVPLALGWALIRNRWG
jgi:hypothetical protein